MSESMQELQKYKQIIGRRKKTFIFTCILITSAVIVSGYMYPKEYRADSTVFVEENIIRSLVEGLAYTSEVQDYVKVLKDAMLSRSMIKKVLDGMEPDLVNNASPITQSYISSLQQKTKIKVKGEELFTVSIDDRNPLFA
ncbi:MAG: hypothetical protein C0609_12115, partial [Deltaproteobacteria bacterium]